MEIKRVASKVPDNQLRYLTSKKGILVSLRSADIFLPASVLLTNRVGTLCDWFSRSSLRLLRDAFNPDKAKGGTGWVVVLRGHSAKKNFERMLKASGRRECFWAFKNNPTSIKSVLELSKGDQLLFLFASTKGAGQGEKYEGNKMMLNAGNMNIEILDWYIGEVKDPYYMVPSGPRSTFFEAGKPPINDRRWPHFVGFSIVSKMRAKIPEKFRRRELARSFAISANHGGIPVRLPPNYWEELISRLKARQDLILVPNG